jgi:hypothetical protein
MLNYRPLILILLLWLTGCAAGNMAVDAGKNDKYVEISNPAYTMLPGAPATIWVPRESEENGPLRGGVLVGKGVAKVVHEIKSAQSQLQPQTAPSEILPTGR